MRAIAARDIKRRGISVVDEALEEGPLYIIKNDQPRYVVMQVAHFQELVEAQEEASRARLSAALEDVQAGRVRKVTAQQLIGELGLED
jgi:PHD/YefM family antitoxin component YafN of YafNO toxin-antitoxin module